MAMKRPIMKEEERSDDLGVMYSDYGLKVRDNFGIANMLVEVSSSQIV